MWLTRILNKKKMELTKKDLENLYDLAVKCGKTEDVKYYKSVLDRCSEEYEVSWSDKIFKCFYMERPKGKALYIPTEEEELVLDFYRKAQTNKTALTKLKESAVHTQNYSLAARLRQIEHTNFPEKAVRDFTVTGWMNGMQIRYFGCEPHYVEGKDPIVKVQYHPTKTEWQIETECEQGLIESFEIINDTCYVNVWKSDWRKSFVLSELTRKQKTYEILEGGTSSAHNSKTDLITKVKSLVSNLTWTLGDDTDLGKIKSFKIENNNCIAELEGTAFPNTYYLSCLTKPEEKKEEPQKFGWDRNPAKEHWDLYCSSGQRAKDEAKTNINFKIPYKLTDEERTRNIIDQCNKLIDQNSELRTENNKLKQYAEINKEMNKLNTMDLERQINKWKTMYELKKLHYDQICNHL